jgi:hypothetical protein
MNYSEILLGTRIYSNFITIPQTTIDYRELHKELSGYKNLTNLLTKLEQHEDGGYHIHILIKLNTQIVIRKIHKTIMAQQGTIKGLIQYEKIKNYQASINYLNKQETSVEGCELLEFGTNEMRECGGQKKEEKYTEAIEQAKLGKVDEALEIIEKADPQKYLQYRQIYTENLKLSNKVRKKYTAPDFTKEHNKLTNSQQQVWDILQEQPKARRIIWVTGSYGTGKTFLYNYIKENHEYGTYDAGQSASLDNVAYGYDEEGVIAWDLPRTFDFEQLGKPIATVIEKFSDFGQQITSKKYSGKTNKVLGHVIVFSNHEPLEILKHRNIVHITLEKRNILDLINLDK